MSEHDTSWDAHGLQPGHDLPAWRQRRGRGLDPALRSMLKGAAGIGLAGAVLAGGWSMLGRRHHDIPLIEAPAGPLRVRPDNPGGMQLANGVEAGLGVATGEALAPPPETPQPQALRAQIRAAAPDARTSHAAAGLAAAEAGLAGAGSPEPSASLPQAFAWVPQASGLSEPGPADPSAVASVSPTGSRALDTALGGPGRPAVSAASTPAVGVASPAPVASLPARPAAPSTSASPLAGVTPPHAAAKPEPRPLAAPHAADTAATPGGSAVQLAALGSEQAATTEWQRLQHRMPELLGGRSPAVQRAEHDGQPVWRLRTGGFADTAAAAEFCVRVRAKGAGCSIAAF